MAGNPLLLLHVTAGTAGLLLGPVWLVARWRGRGLGPGRGNPVWWVLPALVGRVPIAVAKRRLHGAGVAAPVAQRLGSTGAG